MPEIDELFGVSIHQGARIKEVTEKMVKLEKKLEKLDKENKDL